MTQNVNCGLWVMTYQCRLISYNKCIILLGDVDSWGGYIYVCVCVCVCVSGGGTGRICKFSMLSLNCSVNLKLLFKKVY